MSDNNKDKKESAPLIQDVEEQIEEFIKKKKEEIETGLDDKIESAKMEAKKKINEIEKEFEKEKETLTTYRDVMADYEAKRNDLEKQIKEHLVKAVDVQKEIERLAGATLDELKRVDEFSQKLDGLHKEVEEKAGFLKKDLEEKFGIVAEVLEGYEHENIISDLEQELTKLKKIRELLGTDRPGEPEQGAKEQEQKSAEESPPPEMDERGVSDVNVQDVRSEMERLISGMDEAEAAEEMAPPGEESEVPEQENETLGRDALAIREKYRKSKSSDDEGEISYFQKDDKIILDGENIISTLTKTIEEIKKLFFKIQEDESPKAQFIVKQEIIKMQEVLRKNIFNYIELCNKEKSSLPKYTLEILSSDILNDILEKASMMNWSDQSDFNTFVDYVEDLKDNYYARITPIEGYLKSIAEELGIE
jgi:hypothetical protein